MLVLYCQSHIKLTWLSLPILGSWIELFDLIFLSNIRDIKDLEHDMFVFVVCSWAGLQNGWGRLSWSSTWHCGMHWDANLGRFGNNKYMYAYIVCIFCAYFIYSMYKQKGIKKVQDNHLRIKYYLNLNSYATT